MDSQCGQCKKPYSIHCEQQFDCTLHQAKCFACKPCNNEAAPSEEGEMSQCYICLRRDEVQSLYVDYNCDNYICRFHLLNLDMTQEQTELPCSHSQYTYDLAIFMSSFCGLCGRKLGNKHQKELGLCLLCQRKNFQPVKAINQDQKKETSQTLIIQPSNKQKPEEQSELQHITYQQLLNSNQKLNNQVLLLQQMLKVSEFTRKQIKNAIIHKERDQDCLICFEPFDLLLKKPILLCLQQHLICEKCFKEQLTLINCPLCRDEVIRQKASVSRQRMKTIQLQRIIAQKYETKLQKCLQLQWQQQSQRKSDSHSIQPDEKIAIEPQKDNQVIEQKTTEKIDKVELKVKLIEKVRQLRQRKPIPISYSLNRRRGLGLKIVAGGNKKQKH